MHTAEYPGENVRVLCLDKNGLGPPDRAGLQYANLYQTQEERLMNSNTWSPWIPHMLTRRNWWISNPDIPTKLACTRTRWQKAPTLHPFLFQSISYIYMSLEWSLGCWIFCEGRFRGSDRENRGRLGVPSGSCYYFTTSYSNRVCIVVCNSTVEYAYLAYERSYSTSRTLVVVIE